ncbi:MAG: Ig-like domain-containing protein, partial [Wenzhouxiangellaceae bacterium]
MNTRYPFIAVVAAAWFMAPFTVSAQTLDFDVLIDSDRSATTGCAVTPSGGATLNGFEHRLRATVDPDGSEVVALERASCAGGAFGAPVPVSGVTVPYPLALNTGSGGADAVELAVARGALGGANLSQIRLTFVTDNGSGSDVLATTDGSAGGGPIVFGLPVQIPALSIWGLGALVLVLLTLAWLAHRRMGRVGAVMAVMLVTTATWAMTFAVDGDLTDWAGRAPIAQDSTGDATDGSAAIDLVAAFVVLDGDVLFFRMDVSDTESQAPFASDDAHSTVERSLLDVAAASGLLANDNRGVPDAPLTNFGGGDLGGAVTDHAAGSTVTLGADGSLTVNADGSFQFQAQTGFEGDFSFQYRIGNPLGDSDATVSIQVQTPPEAVAD